MALLTEEQQNVALSALASTLGRPVAEIETILLGDKPTDVDTLVSQRIKAVMDQGESSARGKLQKVVNTMAKDLFGVDTATLTPSDDKKGLSIADVVAAIKETYTPPVDASKLTEEQIKKSDAFRTLEATLVSERKDAQKKLDEAVAKSKQEVDQERILSRVRQARLDLGAVIPEDKKLAAAMDKMLLESIQNISTVNVNGVTEYWQTDEAGNKKRVETDKLIPVSEADFLKSAVESVYTLQVSDPITAPGTNPQQANNNGGGGNGKFVKFKGTAPKTKEEYNDIIRPGSGHDFEAREEVREYWEALQQPKK